MPKGVEHLEEFYRQAQQWPDVVQRLQHVTTRPERILGRRLSKYTMAATWPDGRILALNPRYFGNPELLRERLAASATSGWLMLGAHRPEYILAHEFGHLLSAWLKNQPGTFLPYVDDDSPDHLGYIRETVARWLGVHSRSLGRRSYASLPDEQFSEVYASWSTMPAGDRNQLLHEFDPLITAIRDGWKNSRGRPINSLPPKEREAARRMLEDFRRRTGIQ